MTKKSVFGSKRSFFSKSQEFMQFPSLTKVVPFGKIGDSFKFKVALAALTEFNIDFVAVINVLIICCHVRNTLNKFLKVSELLHVFRSEIYKDDFFNKLKDVTMKRKLRHD